MMSGRAFRLSVYRTPSGWAVSCLEDYGRGVAFHIFRRYFYGDDAENRAIESARRFAKKVEGDTVSATHRGESLV